MNTTDDTPVPTYTVAELEALQAIARAAGIVRTMADAIVEQIEEHEERQDGG